MIVRQAILFFSFLVAGVGALYGQGSTCATAVTLPTNTTATCTNFSTTASTGGSACTGQGFGGSGYNNWFKFCTDAQANCIQLNFNPISLTGAYSMVIYSVCGGALVPGQTGGNACNSAGGSTIWTSTGLGLAPNTCYYMNIWTTNAGTFQICSKKNTPPPNDNCSGATQINSAPTAANNFCYTPSPSDPAPSTFCAFSNENSSWFVFTAQCNGSVTLNITSISCVGGAGGFQIGFYTGTCGNLTNIGCNSGSGGTVTTTVSNLTAGQSVYILIDGNAGSNCSWNISATNTTPAVSPPVTICQGQSVTLNAYGGNTYTWSPGGQTSSSITVSPTSTTTYSVAVNNCVSTTLSTTVTVNPNVLPVFDPVGTVCPGASVTLPATSNNGIQGTWNPATVNTSTAGTTTYTFTPSGGQCASSATMTVTVSPGTTPAFTNPGPLCRGTAFTLPNISNNNITGSWSPAINNTATTTYTFTPAAGQCAVSTTLTVTINQPVTPTFTSIPAICAGGSFSLPATSNNGYAGAWSPAINNTATTTYTFTPTAGQCATTTTLTVNITQPTNPNFAQVGPVCQGATITLSNTSPNGVTGTWSPAINNQVTTTYTFTPTAGLCANTATMTVTVNPLVTPAFNQVGPVCQGSSFTLPNTSTNGVSGSWSPAINNQATTTYTFTPGQNQCATTNTMSVTVTPSVTPTFDPVSPICRGGSFTLPTTSTNSINGSWSPAINNQTTTTYTFTATPVAGSCFTTATLSVTVNAPVVPTFTAISPICNGGTFTLPSASNNGITGSWSPAINNSATTTYTFTPTQGLCATTATLSVTVNQPVTPTFTQVSAICLNGNFTLAATSNNGISGSWSPAINNQVTTLYTFTPSSGSCANSTTMTVTVNNPVTPAFNQVGPICQGTSFSLPATSTNSISGSWLPAINNQVATTYTFSPSQGQCATTNTMTVNITPSVTPTFDPIPAICRGGSFSLPTTSTNSISGSWSPAINNQSTTTYTFSPGAGVCATTATLTVNITAPTTPTFTQVTAICRGGSFTLPTISNNNISGNWSPAINNQSTTTYVFTPASSFCATTASMTVTVNAPITPNFNQVAPICIGGSFTLPTTSTNGVVGSWSPSINNQVTTTYTFSPSVGVCATTTTMQVTVNQPVTPAFTQVGPVCIGTNFTLPSTSTNSISGSWTPAINNQATTTYTFLPAATQCATTATMTVTINARATPTFTPVNAICTGGSLNLPTTSNNGFSGSWSPAVNNQATTTYTFTPSQGQCATTTTMTVTVSTNITPAFTQLGPVCAGSTAPGLPNTSLNGISGTWSPSVVSNTATGTYVFTPAQGQCASSNVSMLIQVVQPVLPTFQQVAPVCNGVNFTLPATSTNGFTGIWTPAINNTQTTAYTFSPNQGQCAISANMTVVVNQPVLPTFPAYGPFCQNSILPQVMLPSMSNNNISGTWNPGMLSTAVPGNIPYVFTPDPNECALPYNMIVVVDSERIPSFVPITAICQGGSISLPVSSLNGIPGSWSPSVNNNITTTYVFTPANGQCAATGSLTVTVNPNIRPSFDSVSAVCSGTMLTALPGTSNNGISGSWSPAINNTQTTQYTFTPASNQCTTGSVNLTIVINQPVIPAFIPVSAICEGGNFSLPAVSTQGISGSWTPAINNTVTTTYTFTPDPGQCALIGNLTVTVNSLPADPILNLQQPTCSTAAVLTISNVTGNLFSVDNGQFSSTLTYSGLSAGSHSVTAQNANGCLSNSSFITVISPPGAPQAPQVVTVQPDCFTSTGTLQIAALPGESYSVDGGSFSTSLTYASLTPGSHTIVAANASGCISPSTTALINAAPVIPAQPALSITQPDCNNAIASVQISAVAGVTFSFDNAAFSAVLTYSSLAPGNHTVIAQNTAGCLSSPVTFTISAAPSIPAAPQVTAIQPTCLVPSGSLVISGVTGENYSINGAPYNTSLTYPGLAPGNYSVTAQNAAGCISAASQITVDQLVPPPSAPQANLNQPDCFNNTGSIQIVSAPGQTYNINGGAFSSNTTYMALNPGTYSIITQTDTGCFSAPTILIIDPPPATPSLPALSVSQPTCTISSGSVQIIGVAGETYSFNGGAFTSILSYPGLNSGNYSVIAENASGCRSAAANTIINPAPLVPAIPVLSAVQPSCTVTSAISVLAQAGVQFSIDGGPFSSSLFYSPVSTGLHTIVAQSADGCTSSSSAVINPVPGSPAAPVVSITQPGCNQVSGSVLINPVSNLLYSFNGAPYGNALNFGSLSPGIYTVTAKDTAGCISSPASITIDQPPAIPPAPTVNTPVRVCQYTAGIPLSATGSGTLQWYAAASGGAASGNAPVPSTATLGTSYYYVSQIVGPCEGPRAIIMVRVEPKPVLDIDRDLRLCYGTTLDLTSLYNTSELTAVWYYGSQPVTNPTSVNVPGTYQLMAANGAGCADTAKVQLTMQPAITAYAGPDDTADFYTPYRLQGSGGGSYLWTPGSPILNNAVIPNPIALLTETTQFILEVRDPIGCNDLDTVIIYVRLGEDFYVPNAFTPNGDGLNDYFSPVPLGGVASLDYFAVYNRFGNLLFQTSDITRRWDGTYAGRPQDAANYVWVLKGKNRRGEVKFLKGNVILIR